MSINTYKKGKHIKVSKNFKTKEFDCHGSGCCSETKIDEKLVEYLQKIREHFGKSVTITSGYRCPIKNGGTPNAATKSYHVQGRAADIVVAGVKPAEVAKYAESIGIKGIGLYETAADGYFTHVDTRSSKSFWYGQEQAYRSTFGGSTTSTTQKPQTVNVDGAKDYYKSYAKKYKVTASALNMRRGASTTKGIIKCLPRGTEVECFGYFTKNGTTIWLYVKDSTGQAGYCSKRYLEEVK